MRSSSSVVQFHLDHRRHGTAAARRSSSSSQAPPDLAESLAATMASVVSLLEAAIRIQEQAAEVLQDLAALTGNETVIQRLRRMKDPVRRPAALHDSLSAQPGRAGSQPRPAVSQRRPSSPAEPLTPQERAVLRLMASRLSRREIGRELYVSLNTVKSHTSAIYRKLGVSNRPEAVQRSRELAIIVGLPFADAAHHQAGGAWANMKSGLGNLAASDVGQLTAISKNRLKSIQYRPALIDGFLAQAGPTFEPEPP